MTLFRGQPNQGHQKARNIPPEVSEAPDAPDTRDGTRRSGDWDIIPPARRAREVSERI